MLDRLRTALRKDHDAAATILPHAEVIASLDAAAVAPVRPAAARKAEDVLHRLSALMREAQEDAGGAAPFPYVVDALAAPVSKVLEVAASDKVVIAALAYVRDWMEAKPSTYLAHSAALTPVIIKLLYSGKLSEDEGKAAARGVLEYAVHSLHAAALLPILLGQLPDPKTKVPRLLLAQWFSQLCDTVPSAALTPYSMDSTLSSFIKQCAAVGSKNTEQLARAAELRQCAVRAYIAFLKSPPEERDSQEQDWHVDVRKALALGLREDLVEKRMSHTKTASVVLNGEAGNDADAALNLTETLLPTFDLAEPILPDTASLTINPSSQLLRPSASGDVKTKITRGKKRLSNIPRVSFYGLGGGEESGLNDWGELDSMLASASNGTENGAETASLAPNATKNANPKSPTLGKSKSIEALGQVTSSTVQTSVVDSGVSPGVRRRLGQSLRGIRSSMRNSVLFVGGSGGGGSGGGSKRITAPPAQ